MKTKSAKKSTRKAINYEKLAAMWKQGKTYEEMGKALGMKGNEANDPYKPVRAAISNMLNGRATAWKDKSGKVCTLAPREGMHNFGVGKKMHRSLKKATKKAVAKKSTAPKVDGKSAAAGER